VALVGASGARGWRDGFRGERLQRAARCQPACSAVLSNLAAALQRSGQLGPAVECYRRALDLDPHNPDVLYNLGSAARASGDPAAAARAYRHAIELRPDFVEP